MIGVKIEDIGENAPTSENFHIKLNISDYDEYTRSTTNYEIEFTGAQLLSNPSLDKPIKVKGREKPIKLYWIRNFKWLAGKIVRRMLHDGIISKEEYLKFIFDHLSSNYIRLNYRDFHSITDKIVQTYYICYAPIEIIDKYKDNGGFLSFISPFIEKLINKSIMQDEILDRICYCEEGGNLAGFYHDNEKDCTRPRHEKKRLKLCSWALFYLAIKNELNEMESVQDR